MAPTDSQTVAMRFTSLVAFVVVCLSGIAAGTLHVAAGYVAVELLALMVAGCALLVFDLNLRLVEVLRRQRRRKVQGGE